MQRAGDRERVGLRHVPQVPPGDERRGCQSRSEEHTSELQSRLHLVCRLLLEKKKNTKDANQREQNTVSTWELELIVALYVRVSVCVIHSPTRCRVGSCCICQRVEVYWYALVS